MKFWIVFFFKKEGILKKEENILDFDLKIVFFFEWKASEKKENIFGFNFFLDFLRKEF